MVAWNLQDAKATDPVCGMEIDTTTSLTYEHEGNTYVFCSRGCMLDFKDEPRRYTDPRWQPKGMDDLPA